MSMVGNYPAPVYSLRNQTTSANGSAIDIGACTSALVPPVMIVDITGTVNYVIEGTHNPDDGWFVFTANLTADCAKDLVLGVRFWRVTASSVTGSITASVGAVPARDGNLITPNLYTRTNNPTMSA